MGGARGRATSRSVRGACHKRIGTDGTPGIPARYPCNGPTTVRARTVAWRTSTGGWKIPIEVQTSNTCNPYDSPIALDLDGSGVIEIGTEPRAFDLDADGSAELLAEWFAGSGDGILYDATKDGAMSGAMLFGNEGGTYPSATRSWLPGTPTGTEPSPVLNWTASPFGPTTATHASTGRRARPWPRQASCRLPCPTTRTTPRQPKWPTAARSSFRTSGSGTVGEPSLAPGDSSAIPDALHRFGSRHHRAGNVGRRSEYGWNTAAAW